LVFGYLNLNLGFWDILWLIKTVLYTAQHCFVPLKGQQITLKIGLPII